MPENLGPIDATYAVIAAMDALVTAARTRYQITDPRRAAIDDLSIRAHDVRRLVDCRKEIML